jgi:hypothetical protein
VSKLTTEEQRKVVAEAGEGKVNLPRNGNKPKESTAIIKIQVRLKTLENVVKNLSDMQVFNRDRVLKMLADMIAATEKKSQA